MLRRIIAFELQRQKTRAPSLGARFRAQLARIATGTARPKSPALKPGSQLPREWQGRTEIVDVLETGFRWRGREYRSLSKVARAITGAHWSGPRFFGLKTETRP